MADFFKPLSRGTEESINAQPVIDGKLRFKTDTGKLFLDNGNQREEITDIDSSMTEIEIVNMPVSKFQEKIYLASDTCRIFWFRKSDNTIVEIASTARNVESAKYAIFSDDVEEEPNPKRIANITYVETRLTEEISKITSFEIKIVNTLPSSGEKGTIYFVPSSDPDQQNVYEEYIWINNAWELIGSTKIDLSEYYNQYEVTGEGSFITGVSATTSTSGAKLKFTKSNTGTVSYATNAGSATYATNAGTATNATSASYATNAGSSTYATNAGSSTYATNAGTATRATNASSAGYATNAGTATRATNADSSTYSNHGIETITRDQATFTVTRSDGTTFTFAQLDPGSSDYRYSSGAGINVDNNSMQISNKGVREIATGTSNGTIKVNTNGTTANVAVKGLGNLAYLSSTTATTANYATNAGTATYATNAGTATRATNASTAVYSTNSGTADYASKAYEASYATSATEARDALYASDAGTATYATNAGTATRATNASSAGYATNAGTATNANSATYCPNGIKSFSSLSTATSTTFTIKTSNNNILTSAIDYSTINAGSANYATNAGSSSYATNASSAGYADVAAGPSADSYWDFGNEGDPNVFPDEDLDPQG